jgi:L-ascorbate metabolism protein UlaG (beta-lactamase superfamily)
MIIPAKKELIKEINTTKVKKNEIVLWWLGQTGFVIKSNNSIIYIDPYLSDYCRESFEGQIDHTRLTESPLKPEEVTNADIVISTHDHLDHLDPVTIKGIAESSPDCCFIAPKCAFKTLSELGISNNRIISTIVGKELKIENIIINTIPAKHEQFDLDEKCGYPYQCFIIKINDITIFHSGDCILYDGFFEYLKKYKIDVAMLSINGRDEKRLSLGLQGNFTIEEASEIASKLKVKLLIPMHYDMFAINTVDVNLFKKYIDKHCPKIKYHIFKCADKLKL